jgi:hypothetical protein
MGDLVSNQRQQANNGPSRPLNEIFQSRSAQPLPVYAQTQYPPFLVVRSLNADQQIYYRHRQRELFNVGLAQYFPVKYMIFHACLLLLLGIVCISLQIVLIVREAPYFYLANGIWAGAAAIALSLYYAVFGKEKFLLV